MGLSIPPGSPYGLHTTMRHGGQMLILFVTHPAVAWDVMQTEDGAEMRWSDMPVAYSKHREGAPDLGGIDQALDQSFRTWDQVADTAIVVEATKLRGSGEVALDDVDSVFFDPEWPWDGDTSLALTTVWSDEWGNILAFDIRVNGNVPWSTTPDKHGFDLQAAVTHEVGHVLGLDHSSNAEATMYAEHGPGEVWRRALHEDDLAGAHHLYGDGNYSKNGPEPATVGELMGCATIPRPVGLLALLTPLLSLRRTHREPETECSPCSP